MAPWESSRPALWKRRVSGGAGRAVADTEPVFTPHKTNSHLTVTVCSSQRTWQFPFEGGAAFWQRPATHPETTRGRGMGRPSYLRDWRPLRFGRFGTVQGSSYPYSSRSAQWSEMGRKLACFVLLITCKLSTHPFIHTSSNCLSGTDSWGHLGSFMIFTI